MDSYHQKCSRDIKLSKYERNDPAIRNIWYKLFDELETKASRPMYNRPEELEKTFSFPTLRKIVKHLSHIQPGEELLEQIVEESIKSESDDDESDEKREEIGDVNPYLNFFKRRPDRAAIWYPLKPLAFEDMNLIQRSNAISEKIAVEFVGLMRKLVDENGTASATLTADNVRSMFEPCFDTHAAKSLQVQFKQLCSISDEVAQHRKQPSMAYRSKLHRQILRDIPPKTSPLYKKRPQPTYVRLAKAFLQCRLVHKDVQSMATVWRGITHLKSTRAYCQWLIDHPDIKRPQYLIEANLLDEKKIAEENFSIDTKEEEAITKQTIAEMGQ